MSFITIPTRSVFKGLLVGLLVSLLVLNSGAAPTGVDRRSVSVDSGFDDLELRAPPASNKPAPPKGKPAPKGKAPPKAKASGKGKGKAAAPSKPKAGTSPSGKAPSWQKVCTKKAAPAAAVKKTKRDVDFESDFYRRAGPTTHPSGKTKMTMFHGTYRKDFADSAKAPDFSTKSLNTVGDLHCKGGNCHGVFYMTDSLFGASQFACFSRGATGKTDPTTAERGGGKCTEGLPKVRNARRPYERVRL